MFCRFIAVIFFGLVCLSSIAQQKEQRVALVIGNSSYKSSPLRNPVNDARDMANSLRGYGFTVIERSNLTTRQVGQTLREFRSKLTPGSVAVVFYAGHGVQIKGENYLPTVDAEINGEEDVPLQSLSTRQVMDVLVDAKTRMNLVFLDACRDNPYARSFRSGSRGIAKENAPSGTLISFATRPGSVAADGDGRNGLYTSVLLEQIKQSNQPIEQVLKRVVIGVKVASKGQQEPWMEGSIEGDFCFGACQSEKEISIQYELESWQSATRLNLIQSYQVYLNEYPRGRYAEMAKLAIARIEDEVSGSKKPQQSTNLKPINPPTSSNVHLENVTPNKEIRKAESKQPSELTDGFTTGSKIHMVGGANGGKPYQGFILNIKPKQEDIFILNGNYTEALRIYQQLDKDGDLTASHNLGMMLFRGLGVERSPQKALQYFEKSMNSLPNYATSQIFYEKAKLEASKSN